MGLPIPNLDDKTFEELVKEARSLIPRYAPEWTDHNVHDPGITFMELFAWLAEMQIYQLNRVTDANYLKFLALLGLQPFPPRPARVEVAFANVASVKILEKGIRFIAGLGADRIFYQTEAEFTLVPCSLQSIICRVDGKSSEKILANGKAGIHFAPFGEPAAVGAALELGFDRQLPGAEIQLFFDLFEEDLPPLADYGPVLSSVQLAWEYLTGGSWVPLSISKDSTLGLTRSGRITFTWPQSVGIDGGWYRLRCRLAGGRYEISPLISAIRLNTVSALQLETVRDEFIGSGLPGQSVELKNSPVIPGSLKIELQGDNSAWEEMADFDSSGPDDRHYAFDQALGVVVFGNGLNGRVPEESQWIKASYQTTKGADGNLPAGQLFTIDGGEGLTGTNLDQAAGGASAETLEEAKERAKKDLRTTTRAITAADYQELALATPGIRVARATAIPGYHPEYPCFVMPGAVTVVAVPMVRSGSFPPIPGERFLQAVFAHLDAKRLITTDLHVIGSEYVKVVVSCKVHPRPQSDPQQVVQRVLERLQQFLDPITGGPDNSGWPFGRPVYPSEIYQLLDKTEGVEYATTVVLTAEGGVVDGGIVRIPRTALVVSGEHQVNII